MLRSRVGVPLHRLERLQANLGVPLPAGTQHGVIQERAEGVAPVLEVLLSDAANAGPLYTDDTYMRVLEYMGKRRAQLEAAGALEDPERIGIYTTGVVAKNEGHTIVLYFTRRQHAGENLNDRRDPVAPRPYRGTGYPWLPAIYLLASLAIVVVMLATSPPSPPQQVGRLRVGERVGSGDHRRLLADGGVRAPCPPRRRL
ncbi:MAG: transposase [Polyangiaceae bacterium]|nr:transposase [Polyangiaceae bacterium]